MNPVLGIIGNLLGGGGNGTGNVSNVGSAQANSANKMSWIMGIANTLFGSANPEQTLKTLSQNNPIIKDAMNYVQQNGGNEQAAFYKLAEERGVDPNEVISTLNTIKKLFDIKG